MSSIFCAFIQHKSLLYFENEEFNHHNLRNLLMIFYSIECQFFIFAYTGVFH